jgi:hypothetical protein
MREVTEITWHCDHCSAEAVPDAGKFPADWLVEIHVTTSSNPDRDEVAEQHVLDLCDECAELPIKEYARSTLIQ